MIVAQLAALAVSAARRARCRATTHQWRVLTWPGEDPYPVATCTRCRELTRP